MKREEFIYIHIKKRKYRPYDSHDGTAFYINADHFADKPNSEIITKQVIQKNNPYKGCLYEWLEMKGLFRMMARSKRRIAR